MPAFAPATNKAAGSDEINVATVDDVNIVTGEEEETEDLLRAPEIDDAARSDELYKKASPVNFEDVIVFISSLY